MESKSFAFSRIFVCCANLVFLVSYWRNLFREQQPTFLYFFRGWNTFFRDRGSSGDIKVCPLHFQISGFALMSLGALLLADDKRILLSRLLGPGDIHPEQPLFYYLAFAVVGLGFLITLTGLLGCWATCIYNRCVTISVRHRLLQKNHDIKVQSRLENWTSSYFFHIS